VIVLAEPARAVAGSLRFIRYGFMPNQLRYCGGDGNRTLFDYAIAGEVDGEVAPLLRQFTGALPYLQLIARENGIADPFDDRVVEAYWLGNDLLSGVEASRLYDALRARFEKQLTAKTLELVAGKAPAGAHPHHNFHVFDVHSRAGQLEHSLLTMDQCRVSWGKVVRIEGPSLVVERQRLVLIGGKLALGAVETVTVARQIDGHGFADAAAPGDWVSLHWGWVCEVIGSDQQERLAAETAWHLRLANETL
jgi:hydrogenase maturation factor